MKRITLLLLVMLTSTLSATEYLSSGKPDGFVYPPPTYREPIRGQDSSFTYANLGAFAVLKLPIPWPELGLGYRRRFDSSLGLDVAASWRPMIVANQATFKCLMLYYLSADTATDLGHTYIGLGPSADILTIRTDELWGEFAFFQGHAVFGREYFAEDGSKRFLQLVLTGPVPVVSLGWGRQF